MDTKKIIIIGKNACEGMNVKKEDRVRAGWEEKRELSIEQALSSLLSIDTNKEVVESINNSIPHKKKDTQ